MRATISDQKHWPFGKNLKYRLCGHDSHSSAPTCDHHQRQTDLCSSAPIPWISCIVGRDEQFLVKSLVLTCTLHSLLGRVFAGSVPTCLLAGVLSKLLLGLTLPAVLGAGGPPGPEGPSAGQPFPGTPRPSRAPAALRGPHCRGSPESVREDAQPRTPAYSQ